MKKSGGLSGTRLACNAAHVSGFHNNSMLPLCVNNREKSGITENVEKKLSKRGKNMSIP